MKLPTIKKILREDLKDAPSWVNGLVDPLNTFMETTYQALNKNITLNDNIASFTTELTYRTVSTYPTDQPTQSFMNILKTRPFGVQLLQILDKSTYLPPTGAVGALPWILNGNQIVIHPITGLAADKTYIVRLVIF